MLGKDRVRDYILANGLPDRYQNGYKLSGKSLEEFIKLNYLNLNSYIMTQQYLDQQEQKAFKK